MANRARKVYCSDAVWRVIGIEATHQGVSTTQYVVEAAFARAVYNWLARDAPGSVEYGNLQGAVREFMREYEGNGDQPA